VSQLPTYRCNRVSVPPSIDGLLNDPVWSVAEVTTPFIVASGEGLARRQTVARAVWDDRALYVGFDCVDPDVWGTYFRPGDPVYEEEVVEVFVTPSADDLRVHTAFELSPRNVLWMSRHTQHPDRTSSVERNWDAPGVQTATLVRGTLDDRTDADDGWSAEIAIAFSELGVAAPRDGDVWRINFFRIDRTPEPEFSCWSPTLTEPAAFHVPERFGYLRFIG